MLRPAEDGSGGFGRGLVTHASRMAFPVAFLLKEFLPLAKRCDSAFTSASWREVSITRWSSVPS